MNQVTWFCSNCGAHLGLYNFVNNSVTGMFTIINGNLLCSGCVKIMKKKEKGEKTI